MRTPKHNAGLITKALRLGIWAKGPEEWARINKAKKIGWFNPAVQSRGGKIGGKITGRANKELQRGFCAPDVQSRAGKKGGANTKELQRGIFAPGVRSRCAKARWADPVWAEMQRWKIRDGMQRKKSG